MERPYTQRDVIRERFEAHKQRGKYLAYIVQALDESGFRDFDEAVKRGIFLFGKDKSKQWGCLNAEEFVHRLINDEIAVGTMQFSETAKITQMRAEFTFNRCPLEEGWREMGLTDQQRSRMCGLAREHDFGIVDNDPNLKLEMPQTIGDGESVCRLIITRNH